jgi:hypothetical protein
MARRSRPRRCRNLLGDRWVLIDFLGVPGVGKTTLAGELALELRQQGYDVAFRPIDRLVWGNRYATLAYHLTCIARWTLRRPRQAWRLASLFRLFPQPAPAMAIRTMRYWLYTGAFATSELRRARVAILDQGYLQGVFSWALLCPDAESGVVPALARIPVPDVLVVVTAPPDEIQARLAQRPYSFSRLQVLLEADPGWLARTARLVNLIAQAVRTETGCAVVEHVSAPGLPIAQARRIIAAEVTKALACKGGTPEPGPGLE